MSWHPGGAVRCASATYAGRFVVHPAEDFSLEFADNFTVGGNARQRRKQVRFMRRRYGFILSRGGVSS